MKMQAHKNKGRVSLESFKSQKLLIKNLLIKVSSANLTYKNLQRTALITLALLSLTTFPAINSAAANESSKNNRYASSQQIVNKLLVLGDSLSAGYGLAKKNGWVEILKQQLSSSYYHIEVFNASVSGETTFGGLNRTPALLNKYNPQIVLIELGGNDGLQGLPMSGMEHNLDQMVSVMKKRGIRVLLIGMKLPPNYGQYYIKTFEQVYQRVAEKHAIEFVPFMLKNIATKPSLMQADGIHPRAEAQQEILYNIWPHLRKLLPTPSLE